MSLDADFPARQNRAMTDIADTLYLERRDPARSMARYYALSIERDLFDAVLAVRRWGRIGLWSRQIALPCPDRETAAAMLATIAAAKRKRGYAEPTRPC
jgi:predicted DNA-binding WGR domain protein